MLKLFSRLSEVLGGRSFSTERRLHKRASNYWHSFKGEREFPLVDDFRTLGGDFFSQGFILDIAGDQPMLEHVGEILLDEAQIAPSVRALADVPASSLLGQFGRRYPQVLEARQPLTSEHVFVTDAGFRVSCRGALLPLTSGGGKLDRVLGVVSWKSERVAGPGTTMGPEPRSA